MADVKRIYHPIDPFWMRNPNLQNFALDGSTDQLEYIFQAHEAATITKLGIRLGVKTGTTPTYRISLQGVNGSGNPDGTIKGGGSPASATFSPSGLGWADGSWNWITLANSFAIGRGDMLAIVVDYSSGTINGSNNGSFTYTSSVGLRFVNNFPYAITNNAGSRTKINTGALGFGMASSSKAFGVPFESQGTTSINNGSSPSEIGMKFTLPAGMGDTFKIVGVELDCDIRPTCDFDLLLYDGGAAGDTTVLQSVSIDGDWTTNSNEFTPSAYFFNESSLTALTCGNTYRISVQPTSANSVHTPYIELDAAADWAAWPGGEDFPLTQRAGGNWTDNTARRFPCRLIIDDITEPAGGGGGGLKLVGVGGLAG